jgi:hypothetical protein
MREIRQSGSEGGAAGVISGCPYPYSCGDPGFNPGRAYGKVVS